MTLEDVEYKDIASQDAGNAFAAGRLDAAGTYEPFLSKSAEARKGAKVLVSSNDTPGLIVDLLFASSTLAKEKPDVLKKIANGWFKAVDYWETNQDESMSIMSKAFGVSKEELVDIKSGINWLTKADNKRMFDTNEKNNVYETFNLVGDILENNGAAGSRVSAKDKLISNIVGK